MYICEKCRSHYPWHFCQVTFLYGNTFLCMLASRVDDDVMQKILWNVHECLKMCRYRPTTNTYVYESQCRNTYLHSMSVRVKIFVYLVLKSLTNFKTLHLNNNVRRACYQVSLHMQRAKKNTIVCIEIRWNCSSIIIWLCIKFYMKHNE